MILVEPSHKSFPVNSANGELPKKTGYQKGRPIVEFVSKYLFVLFRLQQSMLFP